MSCDIDDDGRPSCPGCGSDMYYELCENCGGEGVAGHDCGEDCCSHEFPGEPEEVHCTRCWRPKTPHGRSEAALGLNCTDSCPGYFEEPKAGCLFPGETCEDFGYHHCHNATQEYVNASKTKA